MHLLTQIYEFSASLGALEGYVYHKNRLDEMDANALDVWTRNLVEAYQILPAEVLEQIQSALDLTLNRAISSFEPLAGQDHVVLKRLYSMLGTRTRTSPDDFQKKKWFQK